MASPLKRFFARNDRYIDRQQPKPEQALVTSICVILSLAGFVIAMLIGGSLDDSTFGLVNTVFLTGYAVLGVLSVARGWRYNRTRAELVYGPNWRKLSKSERAARWADFRTRELSNAYQPGNFADQLAYAPPLTEAPTGDVIDPYQTPTYRP